ncbi:MAG TPA: glycosyltransferase [Hyphomicrobiales bacterium]|nr:glycosyltransferase [Hyphomicrobiales bacterium]
MTKIQIPRKLHLIWLDDKKAAPATLASWRIHHRDWQVRLWSQEELHAQDWVSKNHINALARRRNWPAVAAFMRYEILYREGGVYADINYSSLRPLEDWLLENEMFLCWMNTLRRSALVNDALIGSVAANPFLNFVIDTLSCQSRITALWGWSAIRRLTIGRFYPIGAYQLTRCIHRYGEEGYHNVSILPSNLLLAEQMPQATGGKQIAFAARQSPSFRGGSRVGSDRASANSNNAKRHRVSVLPAHSGKIAVDFLHRGAAYSGATLRSAPMGGIESSVVQLAEALAKRGHAICVFNGIDAPRQEYGVNWWPISEAKKRAEGQVGVAVATPKNFDGLSFSHRIFWLHNPLKGRRLIGRGEIFSLLRHRPLLVLLGDYHAEHVPRLMPVSGRKIIHHGIGEEFFRKTPLSAAPLPRAIFTSQPYRDLDWLLELWEAVRQHAPNAVLDVFAPKLHQGEANARRPPRPGINFRGSISRASLRAELGNARVQLIPGHGAETFCLAAAEAIAMGVPVVTRGIGALSERVEEARTGFIAPDKHLFIARTVDLLLDDDLWLKMHRFCFEDATLESWDVRAEDWERLFASLAQG